MLQQSHDSKLSLFFAAGAAVTSASRSVGSCSCFCGYNPIRFLAKASEKQKLPLVKRLSAIPLIHIEPI
jgi:hypothetical protein